MKSDKIQESSGKNTQQSSKNGILPHVKVLSIINLWIILLITTLGGGARAKEERLDGMRGMAYVICTYKAQGAVNQDAIITSIFAVSLCLETSRCT